MFTERHTPKFLSILSDRYGRNKLLVLSAVGMALFEIGAAFSVNFIMLVTMRFLVGVFTAGARNSAFVYGTQFYQHSM